MGRPEDKYVKIPALIHATRIGYTYKSIHGTREQIDYDPDTNIFFAAFRKGLQKVNGKPVSEVEAKELVRQLRLSLSASDLGRDFFNKLQVGIDGYRLVDFDSAERNVFEVVTELTYANGEDEFRPDITFLVNGMPLFFMEAKRQNNKDGIIAERERMHKRFENEAYRRFVNITQVMAFSNNQEYDDNDRQPVQGSYYASSAYGRLMFNHFREEDEAGMLALVRDRDEATEKFIVEDNNLASYYGTPEYELSIEPTTPANRIITSLFSPERALFLLRYGICYVERADEGGVKHVQKHVMRYPQLFATQAVDGALSEGRKKGVIWHTQGSGKTALSFFLSRYLRDWYQARGQVARFFFIVDRLDLAEQAKNEFESRGAYVNMVSGREDFKRALTDPSIGSGGVDEGAPPAITVVNIQKFGNDSSAAKFDYSLEVQRVYFIDEAHRDYKQNGAFLSNLISSDRDAVKIALTGTPLVDGRKGNATKQVFGNYIHKYFYNQSIADGYTLKLLREEVQTEFRLKMREVVRDLQEIDKLVKLDDVFKHDSYVNPLVDYIVEDYMRSQIELGDSSIGSMIVAQSSEQARKIYRRISEMDQDVSAELILHDEGTKESRKAITDNFRKDDSNIDILVVFNMLLTGFDAHRLKKLYLCRPIKAHNLLQALTRVNRPYKDMANGFVVDFADITEEYDKTNRAYLRELNEELGDAAQEYSSLFEDPKAIEADLARIRDVLFSYTTDNVVEFQREISAIDDKAALYELRAALLRYKDLRNVANMHGYEELYEHFDVDKAQELLREVELRIQTINNKEALALSDMSTGAMNLLLSQVEFNFRKLGREELHIGDEFQDAPTGLSRTT
ncbi:MULTISPECIES: DEAD/DEAH box helicase family protein [unclassified Adlercreutzia]|uniref:DEAD/DEAH box helicase family protein n=1 Tax=unclassified Adlercreutzia TaxID=2636013 RepID=UPI00197E3D16|nr:MULTISPECIES: DEAD/DEAH box helicase family protein [unclassified Adlercreutzia]